MLKIMQIKVPKNYLVLQRHPSKSLTTKILAIDNTKKLRIIKIYAVIKRGSKNVYVHYA